LTRTGTNDDIDAVVARQEARFLERQQARIAAGGFDADSATNRKTLAALIHTLNDDDIATLTRVAEGLALRHRPLPE
jgi:hypothetical protein